MPANLLEREVVAACGELIADSKKLRAAIEAAVADSTGEIADAKAALADVDADIAQTDKEIKHGLDHLLEKFDATPALRERLSKKLEELSAKLDKLKDQRKALAVIVGKAPEQTPSHITKQLKRLFGYRTNAWQWRLVGSLGVIVGTATQLDYAQPGTTKLRLAGKANADGLAKLVRQSRGEPLEAYEYKQSHRSLYDRFHASLLLHFPSADRPRLYSSKNQVFDGEPDENHRK